MAKSSFLAFASSYLATRSFHFASCILAIVGEVVFLAVERGLIEFDAEHAGRAAADEDLAVGDDRGAFEVDQVARHRQLPERLARGGVDAVKNAAGVLVHAVAEDEVIAGDRRRTDRSELEERGGLGPRRLGRVLAREREDRRVGRLKAPMPVR